MTTNVIPPGGLTPPGEKLYRKLLAEAAEPRWEVALARALARVAVERERLSREAELLDSDARN
jgi:hypothetical protein